MGSKLTAAWFLFPCDKATCYLAKFYENCKSQTCRYWILVVLRTSFCAFQPFSPLQREGMGPVAICSLLHK